MILPLDLRLRLVTVVGALFILSPLAHLGPGFAWLGLTLALTLTHPEPFPWRRLVHLEAFLVLLLITLPLTIPGEALFQVGSFGASREGMLRALLVAAKVTAAMLLLTTAFSRVEPVRLGQALRGLGCPEALVRLLLSVIRYLGLMRAEAARLQDAMRMRAFVPRTRLHTWRSYGNLIGMTLLRAMARADRVEEAMRMRGSRGLVPVSPLPPAARRDWLAGGLFLAAVCGLLIWDLLWAT